MAEEQTHFEIIECESHMPVAIRQFDSEEEAMEYLNMRLKSEQPTHPSERIELYAALNNQRTRKALGITVESSPCKQNRQRINTQ